MKHAYRVVDLMGREEWRQEEVSLLNLAVAADRTDRTDRAESDIEYELRCV